MGFRFLFVCFLLSVFATPVKSAALTISGEVSPINEVSVQDYGLSTGVFGGQLAQDQEVPMIRFVLNNNNSNGFYVNFSSQNHGYLVSADEAAERVAYRVSTRLDTPALLGSDIPQDISGVSLDRDVQLVFNANIKRATRNCAYVLSVAPTAPMDQHAVYRDGLTITIHNL